MADELTRICFRCGRELPVWDFPLNRKYITGRDIRCRDCVHEHREKFDAKWRDKEKKMRGMR